MSILTPNPILPVQTPDEDSLVLRLYQPTETKPTRQLLAFRPRLAEAAGVVTQHPSRVYIQFGGSELFGAVRVHLQVHRGSIPRLALQHPECSEAAPNWYGLVGYRDKRASPCFLYPQQTHTNMGFVHLSERPILGLRVWVGPEQGIDMQLVRLKGCPDTNLTIFPLQVGREFTVPSSFQSSCFVVATGDLPVSTDLD